MNENQATEVLRRLLPDVPQRRLATVLDTESDDFADELIPGFSGLSEDEQAEFRTAYKIAAYGQPDDPNIPGKATIYGRIRRADGRLKQAQAQAQAAAA